MRLKGLTLLLLLSLPVPCLAEGLSLGTGLMVNHEQRAAVTATYHAKGWEANVGAWSGDAIQVWASAAIVASRPDSRISFTPIGISVTRYQSHHLASRVNFHSGVRFRLTEHWHISWKHFSNAGAWGDEDSNDGEDQLILEWRL